MAAASGVPPLKTFVKDPDSKLDYMVDWSKWLGSDTISTSVWLFDPTTELTNTSPSIDTAAKRTSVFLAGGTVGTTYRVTNRITTAAGRIVDRSFNLLIAER